MAITVFEAQKQLNKELKQHGLMVNCEDFGRPFLFDLYRVNETGSYVPFWIPWTENDWMGEGRRHANFPIGTTSQEIIDFATKYVKS